MVCPLLPQLSSNVAMNLKTTSERAPYCTLQLLALYTLGLHVPSPKNI